MSMFPLNTFPPPISCLLVFLFASRLVSRCLEVSYFFIFPLARSPSPPPECLSGCFDSLASLFTHVGGPRLPAPSIARSLFLSLSPFLCLCLRLSFSLNFSIAHATIPVPPSRHPPSSVTGLFASVVWRLPRSLCRCIDALRKHRRVLLFVRMTDFYVEVRTRSEEQDRRKVQQAAAGVVLNVRVHVSLPLTHLACAFSGLCCRRRLLELRARVEGRQARRHNRCVHV